MKPVSVQNLFLHPKRLLYTVPCQYRSKKPKLLSQACSVVPEARVLPERAAYPTDLLLEMCLLLRQELPTSCSPS